MDRPPFDISAIRTKRGKALSLLALVDQAVTAEGRSQTDNACLSVGMAVEVLNDLAAACAELLSAHGGTHPDLLPKAA